MSRVALARLPLLCLVVLVAAACASTPEDRIKENQGLYESYPQDVRSAIRSGQIRPGFDANQVYMALGKPSQKKAESGSETWVYAKVMRKTVKTSKDVYKYELERRQYEEKVARGEYAAEPTMEETKTVYRTRVTRVVEFRNGRVTGWEDPTDRWLDDWHEK